MYTRFRLPVSFGQLRTWFPGFDLQLSKGTEDQAHAYCTKEESRVLGPWEFGTRAQQGKRSDIHDAMKIIKEGGGMRGVLDNDSNFQTLKYAQLALAYIERKRDFMPSIKWFYGSTGGGKTREAFAQGALLCGGDVSKVWVSGKNLKFWQGYDAHEVVIIDDFRKDFCTFHELLRILDRYPYEVEVKFGSRQLLAKHIFITCPWAPDLLYANQADQVNQLLRRLGCEPPLMDRSNIVLFGSEVPMPPPPGASAAHFVSLP